MAQIFFCLPEPISNSAGHVTPGQLNFFYGEIIIRKTHLVVKKFRRILRGLSLSDL